MITEQEYDACWALGFQMGKKWKGKRRLDQMLVYKHLYQYDARGIAYQEGWEAGIAT